MKLTLCHVPGCQETAEQGKHYCTKHIDKEASYGKRPTPVRRKSKLWNNLYDTAWWRKTSREFLKKYPLCAVCGEKAKIADHIKPHRGDPTLFYDVTNLQPLCWRHHSAKTMLENNYYK